MVFIKETFRVEILKEENWVEGEVLKEDFKKLNGFRIWEYIVVLFWLYRMIKQ